jgi:hypothetical protein
MFGLGSSVDAGAAGGAQFIVSLAQMITDREGVVAQLRELAEAMEKIDAARAELSRFEARLLQRERACEAAEKANTKRATDLDAREMQVQAMQMRAEQGLAELASLKADLKSKMAA